MRRKERKEKGENLWSTSLSFLLQEQIYGLSGGSVRACVRARESSPIRRDYACVRACQKDFLPLTAGKKASKGRDKERKGGAVSPHSPPCLSWGGEGCCGFCTVMASSSNNPVLW